MHRDTIILEGKSVAKAVYAALATRVSALKSRGITPKLAVVLVGDDPASQVYVRSKERAFERNELDSETMRLPVDTSEADLLAIIDNLNVDESVHGILVQMPVPKHIDPQRVIERISADKDVDGFHPMSQGRILIGNPHFISCTPHGILQILEHYEIPVARRHVVIVGRSNIVGKPMMALLANKWERGNATVTICHTGTPDIAYHTRQADVLIVASGIPGLVTGDMVKEGVDIVDVGMNRVDDDSEKGYHLTGDVVTEEMIGKANSITPVPGGVGLMTVAMLAYNTVLSAESITVQVEG